MADACSNNKRDKNHGCYLFCCYIRKGHELSDMLEFGNGVILGWIYSIIAVILIINVILKNRDSVKTLAWVLVLLFLPVIGILLYFFFHFWFIYNTASISVCSL